MSHICKKLRSAVCCFYGIRAFVPISVRKVIVHALTHSPLRYGITVSAHCSGSWHTRAGAILKNILTSVAFGSNVLPDSSLYVSLQFPSFYALFVETVILKHNWSNVFKSAKSSIRGLRQGSRFYVTHCKTHYGEWVREFYVRGCLIISQNLA